MDARLAEISMNGDVSALHHLLVQDPLILDTVTIPTAQETPLHVASLLGHADLAAEILKRRPSLARVRDGRGSYPLHLASAKGHLEVAKKLLDVDASLRSVRDKNGWTPLHLAAANDQVKMMEALMPANERRRLGRVLTESGETVLHLSVKYNQLEAAKFIVENDKEVVNVKDERGNTALHLAAARRNIQMLKLLLQENSVEVNAMNETGCTAVDIVLQCLTDIVDMEACEILLRFGGKKGLHERASSPVLQQVAAPNKIRWTLNLMPHNWEKWYKEDDNWLKEMHNTIMIVSTLIAGATFQSGLNPPGGLWDDKNNNPHRDPGYFLSFVILDTIALGSSLAIILSLVSGLPLRNRLWTWVLIVTVWVAVSAMALAFLMGANLLSSKNKLVITFLSLTLFCWLLLVTFLLCYHFLTASFHLLKIIMFGQERN